MASEFAAVSGFSASLGVAFQDISQLIDDPEAVVEGIRALLDLARSEGLGAAETLVKAMAQDIERKQAVNNPYGSLEEKEQADLYDTFRENWYEGYAAGFLAKMVLDQSRSGSVKTALKSSDKVQDVGSKLSDTKALRALERVSDAKKAAKGRATARILLAVDGDAAEPLLSQADTAGGAYRLWRHQRAMDADIDTLPETQQRQLSRYLLQTGDDGAKFIDEMDQSTRDTFLSIRRTTVPDGGSGPDLKRAWQLRLTQLHDQDAIDNDDFRRIVQRTSDADPAERDVLFQTVAEGGENGARVVSELDDLSPLYRFDADTGTDGIELIRTFDDPETAQRFFELDGSDINTVDDVELTASDLDDVRANLAKFTGNSDVPRARAEQFIDDIDEISDITGAERIAKSLADANSVDNVDGATFEARVASSSDQNIAELERELGPQGTHGELDLIFKDGTIGEVKATDASDYKPNGDRDVFDVSSQIAGWNEGTDLDGRTIEIYVKETPTNGDVDDTIGTSRLV
ncbi:hypothetical protein [Halopiger thermotolerans]